MIMVIEGLTIILFNLFSLIIIIYIIIDAIELC